jgi:hypothetical protein
MYTHEDGISVYRPVPDLNIKGYELYINIQII